MLPAFSTRLRPQRERSPRAVFRAHWIGVAIALFALMACGPEPPLLEELGTEGRPSDSEFVTTAVCAGCHAEAYARWAGSLHDRAMEPSSEGRMLGDFSLAPFERRGDQVFFRGEDFEGQPVEYALRYSFGAFPLQQYLVEQSGGRLQVLDLAWDARSVEAGGQRWFSLREDEAAAPLDVMHWTGFAHNWNTQCADCHSTGVRRGFDPESGSYETTWSDIDVGCEACHGPGSRHVAWAESTTGRGTANDLGLERRFSKDDAVWRFSPGDPIARRTMPLASSAELESCAPCHSRRSQLREVDPGVSFLDAYRPELLEPGLYHADGQILDEVYVWGSFVQSRMYRAGVRCSDCHDPHSLELRGSSDQVCAQCHASEHFSSPAHHHHPAGSPGSSCVDCHMPARSYMQIDLRRDHGFRIPRPDLGERAGVPDACTDCHVDRVPEWAADAIAAWTGTRPGEHFSEALAAARRGVPSAAPTLARLARDREQAGIVRATLLSELVRVSGDPGLVAETLREVRDDGDPLVRYGAARAAQALPLEQRVSMVGRLTRDPVGLVRAEAGRVLAEVPVGALPPEAQTHLDAALETYREAQFANADRPSAYVNLGLLSLRRGDLERAEEHYRRAIHVGPHFIPAYVNLADLLRRTERDSEGQELLERALRIGPGVAEVHHALGLLLVRQKRLDSALGSLARAAELAPANPRLVYVYGIALHSAGQRDAALEVLEAGLERSPYAPDLLRALVEFSRAAGRSEVAAGYAQRLRDLETQSATR